MTRRAYKPRSIEQVERRASGAGDFDSYADRNYNFFKPKDNTNQIRIMYPTWTEPEPDDFGLEIHVHYGIGANNVSYLCPKKMLGEECPICEEAARAKNEGDEEYAKQLFAKQRCLVWLIDRENEDQGPVLWAMPRTLNKDINSNSIDKITRSVLPIDHPDDGYDIFFDREKGGQGYYQYKAVQVARASTPLSSDESKYNEWLDFIHENPLPEVLEFHDYDHINREFTAGVPTGSSQGKQGTQATQGQQKEEPQNQKQEEEADKKEPDTDDAQMEQKAPDDAPEESVAERRRNRLAEIRSRKAS